MQNILKGKYLIGHRKIKRKYSFKINYNTYDIIIIIIIIIIILVTKGTN